MVATRKAKIRSRILRGLMMDIIILLVKTGIESQ